MKLNISSGTQELEAGMKRISLSFGRSIPTALACYWYLGRRWRDGTVAVNNHGAAVQVWT
jgi:hypothetical protein